MIDRTLISGIDSRCWLVPPDGTDGGVAMGGYLSDMAVSPAVGGTSIGGLAAEPLAEEVEGGYAAGGSVADPDTTAAGGTALGGECAEPGSTPTEGGFAVGCDAADYVLVPGLTCGTAAPIVLGVTYSLSIPALGSQWILFTDPGFGYHMTGFSDLNNLSVTGYIGSCAVPIAVFSWVTAGCSATVSTGPTIWVNILNPSLVDQDYTILFDGGGC